MLSGYWCIPEENNSSYYGTLSTHNHKITLKIYGLDINLVFKDSVEINEIHGIVFDTDDTKSEFKGKFVVLKQCLRNNASPLYTKALENPITKINFSVNHAFITEHSPFVKDLSLKFNVITFEITHLPDFVRSLGHSINIDKPQNKSLNNGIQLTYEYVNFPSIHIAENQIELLGYYYTGPVHIRKASINTGVKFKVTSPETLSLVEWMASFIVPLKNLLTLTTYRRNHITKIEGYCEENFEICKEGSKNEFKRKIPISIITDEILQHENDNSPELPFLIFNLRDIENSYQEKIKIWLHLYQDKKSNSVQTTIFSALFSDNLNIIDRFLNLSKALEFYHSNKYPNERLPKEQFQVRVDKIIKEINNEEDKIWVADRLSYANALSLKERLLFLISNNLKDLKFEEAIGISNNQLANKIRDIRNKFTHGGSLDLDVLEQGLWICFLMEFMLLALLLEELKLPITNVQKVSNYKFRMKKIKSALSI